MSTNTSIEWTDATWNPIRGCSRVSEGCRHCYAEAQAGRWCGSGEPYDGLVKIANVTKNGANFLHGGFPHVVKEPRWTGEVRFIEEHLEDPLRWRKPRRIFVNSMSDLFHEKVPDKWIDRIVAVMALCPQHTFQVLTKRPERMLEYCNKLDTRRRIAMWIVDLATEHLRDGSYLPLEERPDSTQETTRFWCEWPLKNVWLGVSVEDQKTADERIPLLLETPAAIRWVSYEPALAPVNVGAYLYQKRIDPQRYGSEDQMLGRLPFLDWLVVGGESGPSARPFDIQWASDVIAQCKASGVPVFCKQLGAYVISRDDTGFEGDTPRSWPMDTHTEEETAQVYQGAPVRVRLHDRKGGDWNEWPEDLRVREWPR